MDSEEVMKGRFIIFDFAVSALAALLNAIVLIGVIKARLNLKGYKYFLISLILSDMYASFVNIGSYSVQVAGASASRSEAEARCWNQLFRNLQIVSFSINMLTLCGMSVEHFIGVLRPFRYKQIMRKKRIYAVIVFIWLFSFAFGFSDYFIAMALPVTNGNLARIDNGPDFDPEECTLVDENIPDFPEEVVDELAKLLNVENNGTEFMLDNNIFTFLPIFGPEENSTSPCDIGKKINYLLSDPDDPSKPQGLTCPFGPSNRGNNIWLESAVMSLAGVCFFILLICYAKIFIEVFYGKKFGSFNHAKSLPQRSVRRLVVTTVLLLGAFFLSWIPVLVFEFSMFMIAQPSNAGATYSHMLLIHKVLNSVMFAYPLIDPLIYAARLSSVRKALLMLMKQVLPFFKMSEFRSRTSSTGTLSHLSMSRASRCAYLSPVGGGPLFTANFRNIDSDVSSDEEEEEQQATLTNP